MVLLAFLLAFAWFLMEVEIHKHVEQLARGMPNTLRYYGSLLFVYIRAYKGLIRPDKVL